MLKVERICKCGKTNKLEIMVGKHSPYVIDGYFLIPVRYVCPECVPRRFEMELERVMGPKPTIPDYETIVAEDVSMEEAVK